MVKQEEQQWRNVLIVYNNYKSIHGHMLQVRFIVVPERLYITVAGELRCEEGGNVTLPPGLLPPLTEYYVSRLTEYKLAQALLHGRLVSSVQPARTLQRWTPQQMTSGLIQVSPHYFCLCQLSNWALLLKWLVSPAVIRTTGQAVEVLISTPFQKISPSSMTTYDCPSDKSGLFLRMTSLK